MIYSTCRLRSLAVNKEQEEKYLIKARYRSSVTDYKIREEKFCLDNLILHPFSLEELRRDYSHVNFNLPHIVEFCSGTGEFIIDLAQRYPQFLFIGVEVAFPCIQRALINIEKHCTTPPHNLLFYYGEGRYFLSHDFSKHNFNLMMVNFPDPWPKKRHVKRRIISDEFVNECKNRLSSLGSLHTATDVETLYHYHREVIDPILKPMENSTKSNQNMDEPNSPKYSISLTEVLEFYQFSSRYQKKDLSRSQKVFYTHHQK